MSIRNGSLVRRALRIDQNPDHPLYVFTLTAREILAIADISRVTREKSGELIGYQRPEVRRHIQEIVEYLDAEDIVFPNAIILAFSSAVRFRRSRGPNGSDGCAVSGTLEIPTKSNGHPRPGWIVDGQQRALALSRASRQDFPVPVCAFVADDVELQRDQFLRINNTKPLPRGLVTELLPEVTTSLPPRLAARKTPSALCELLYRDKNSPFVGLIRRSSSSVEERKVSVVADTSIVNMLQESLSSTSGCLFPYRNIATGETDFDGIWRVLLLYWQSVRETFPEAWGKPARESRLMHGVGIRAMGRLMDKVMASVNPLEERAEKLVRGDLELIAPHCRWTEGEWEGLGVGWNEFQNVPKHVRILSNHLIRLYVQTKMGAR
jgi:DGQHR domain-containing protein